MDLNFFHFKSSQKYLKNQNHGESFGISLLSRTVNSAQLWWFRFVLLRRLQTSVFLKIFQSLENVLEVKQPYYTPAFLLLNFLDRAGVHRSYQMDGCWYHFLLTILLCYRHSWRVRKTHKLHFILIWTTNLIPVLDLHILFFVKDFKEKEIQFLKDGFFKNNWAKISLRISNVSPKTLG